MPVYTTLVDVSTAVNADQIRRHPNAEMAEHRLAYHYGGDPTKPIVYEDFSTASAAGIVRSNLDADSPAAEEADQTDYPAGRLANAIGRDIHDPYDRYEKAAS